MNFFEAYNRYRKDTESHQHYHLWSALSAISALLGRKCFLPQGSYTIYPQLYTIIVGEAAARKTTAMNIAKRLVKEVGTVPVAPTSSSREALIDFMSKCGQVKYSVKNQEYIYHQAAAFASEFDTFVGGQHVNKSLITFMTDIWDENPYTDLTRKNGLVEVPEPFFTIVGCCVPAWFETSIKGDLITGGFTRRTVFVFEEEMDHLEPWPQGSTKNQNEMWPHMIGEAKRINAMTGQFEFTEKAIELQSRLYLEQMNKKRNVDEKLRSYYASRHDLLKKIAICLSAGFDSSMVVDASIVDLADKLLARTEAKLEKLFRGVGRNELKGYSEKVLDEATKKGPTGISSRALFRSFYGDLSLQELEEVLMVLTRSGLLEVKPDQQVPGQVVYVAQAAAELEPCSCSLFEQVCQRKPSDSVSPNARFGPTSVPPSARQAPKPSVVASPSGKPQGNTVLLAALGGKKPQPSGGR